MKSSVARLIAAFIAMSLAVLTALPAHAATQRFSDVPEHAQFFNEINWLAASGITTGYPDGTYRPLDPVNRDAMAAFLYRLHESPEFDTPGQTFSDVPMGLQFHHEIEWVAAEGIATGYPDGTYRPLDPVNRDAMAAFLFRIYCDGGVYEPTGQTFTDVTPDNQFYTEIEWLASTDITTGWVAPDGSKTFRPTAPIARDAIAAFLFRAVQRFGIPPLFPDSPAAVTGLTATVTGSDVVLSWNPSPERDVIRYDLYRGQNDIDPTFGPVEVTESTYTDTTAPAGDTHYWVIAVSRYGVVSEPATLWVTVG